MRSEETIDFLPKDSAIWERKVLQKTTIWARKSSINTDLQKISKKPCVTLSVLQKILFKNWTIWDLLIFHRNFTIFFNFLLSKVGKFNQKPVIKIRDKVRKTFLTIQKKEKNIYFFKYPWSPPGFRKFVKNTCNYHTITESSTVL